MSRNVKSIERRNPQRFFLIMWLHSTYLVAQEIRTNAEEMPDVVFKGYTRIPTKHLTINCRRSPCGEGMFDILSLQITYKAF